MYIVHKFSDNAQQQSYSTRGEEIKTNFPSLPINIRNYNQSQNLQSSKQESKNVTFQLPNQIDKIIPKESISGTKVETGKEIIQESRMRAVFQDKNRTVLNVSSYEWLRGNLLFKIGNFLPNLLEISLRGIDLKDDALQDISQKCQLLQKIDLSMNKNLTEESIKVLADNFQSLQSCKFNQCLKAITDNSISNFCNSLKQLTVLEIANCEQITDIAIHFISSSANKFQTLNISGNNQITDWGLKDLFQNQGQSLQVFTMCFLEQSEITNQLAISLNFCQNLRELFITGCKQITDSFFDYLTETNEDAEQTFSLQQNLEVLKIGGLVKLTSRALDKISTFVALKILEIANINKLSYEAIAKIVQSCPKLTVLDLRSIKSLKSEEIQQLSQLNQNLKILTTKITQEIEDPENDQFSMKKPKSRSKSRKRKKSSKGKKKKKQF